MERVMAYMASFVALNPVGNWHVRDLFCVRDAFPFNDAYLDGRGIHWTSNSIRFCDCRVMWFHSDMSCGEISPHLDSILKEGPRLRMYMEYGDSVDIAVRAFSDAGFSITITDEAPCQ
jgi:hypothetical protein